MRLAVAPEDQLLLLLARGNLLPLVQEQALALLATPLRWDLILERAETQGVYPLFYRNLATLGFPGVPEDARTQLHHLSRINLLRNTLLTEELVRVLTRLGDAGIPTIPLKGVALAESLYGDPALRACVDIDILVPRPMVARALQILRPEGYESEFTSGFFADLLLRHDIEYALTREERGSRYLLELHWGLLWGLPWDKAATEEIWAEAQPGDCFGIPAYRLSPEWELLFLAVHAARHQCQGLKWLVDIDAICSTRSVDWEKVRELAARAGWEEAARLAFGACQTLFDTPIPSDLLLRVLPPWVILFPATASASLTDAFFPARLLRRPSEKLRFLLRVLLVPTLAERRLLLLPSFLGLLYYPLRPLRLTCKWSWLALCGVLGNRGQRAEQGAKSKEQRAKS